LMIRLDMCSLVKRNLTTIFLNGDAENIVFFR